MRHQRPWEIFFILVVILLLFGAKRLPEMAKGIGQSVREFRRGIRGIPDDGAHDADRGSEEPDDRPKREG